MKNLKYTVLTASLAFCALSNVFAQKQNRGTTMRCATMERIAIRSKDNPMLRANQQQSPVTSNGSKSIDNTFRITSIVTIPVVVHIVLPNPYLVTDADVQAQVDKLNMDYAGLNPDSTNVPPQFAPLRGHSQVRFCLAKRTPANKLTSGIERRSSGTGSDINGVSDPIKYFAQGGLDAWDPTQYLNYWVGVDGTSNGILGYAQFPNSTADPITSDGVFVNYKAWGMNSCYVYSAFNQGRTAVHETGHYLGLFHTWGDDGSACTGDDFTDLSSVSACTLPTGLFNPSGMGNTASDIGDTPNQTSSTSGCPGSLVKTDGCSSTSPGVMYQDYLDYTDDRCMTMFTKKQVERMEWVLANCRATLLTSQGCQPPVGAPSLDAMPVQSVNPGGSEVSGCNSISYSSVLTCPGNIAPKFRIANNGLTTLTSVTVGYKLNGGAPVTQTLNVNLVSGASTVVSFPAAAVVAGINTFKFFTSNPNGSADQLPSNDTLTQTMTVLNVTTSPLSEGFESTTFPPLNWAVDNYDLDSLKWERKTPGRNGSFGELFINNYGVDATGTKDDFKSPRITTTGFDSVVITFDLAHKYYPQTGYYDTLSVLITKDCGATYQSVYKKTGPTLATAGSSTNEYLTPAAGDWRTERIVLSGSSISSGEIEVVFRNSSNYGNDIHIDNINIAGKNAAATYRDLTLTNILFPAGVNCSSAITPQVVITNTGTAIITSFQVGYRIGAGANVIQTFNQSLDPGASATLSLTPVAAPFGINVFTAFTANPVDAVGTGDAITSNDTLTKQFSVLGAQTAPLAEGFESATFPPINWGINNPDQSIKWQRYSLGNLSSGSALLNTYNYTSLAQIDELYTPAISYSNVDSVLLTFDVAATYRNTSAEDTLTVLVTTDCGNTFTTAYKKWGDALKTVISSQSSEFVPSSSIQWRNEKVDLTAFVNQSPISVVFRVSNDHGNNIFIDNVNLTTKTLPPTLKRRGYLIVPTAFRDQFAVWYYQVPTTLKYINVYNSSGQLVVTKQFSNNTDSYITVDMSGKAAGSYLVRLGYDDPSQNVSQWVIKY